MSVKTARTARISLGLAATTLATGAAFIPVTSANAATAARNGVCETGEFCYYYNSNQAGSVSDFSTSASLANYGATLPSCYIFKGAGAGKGLCIKNHAASVWNRSTKPVTVYFNSYFGGTRQTIAAGAKVNLITTLKNQNASHSVPGTVMTDRLVNDYPYRGATGGVDPWLFYKGQCTSFAAWRVNHNIGVRFTNNFRGQHFGNANHWATAARAAGLPVSTRPHVGDIAVRTTGTYGHVAYVAAVNPNGSFTVEEYNHVARYTYSVRTSTVGTASSQFNYFINFKG